MWMKAESPHFELLRKKILLLFEGGYEFEKQMLIQLWMALELLTDDDMEENGANYFEMLVSEGYIQRSVANSLYKANIEKLNSPALDLIKGEQNCAILDNGNWNSATLTETTTLHISVVFNDNEATIFKTLQRFKQLKTLLFLGDSVSTLQQLPVDLFLRHKYLVALDLSGTHVKEMPTYAEEMIHLRYLDLSWTFIELLPERIFSFKELQTLKLKGCSRLRRLPNELKCLTELRHLDLDVLEQLICFPKGIGALEKLRTLSAFPVGTVEGHKINELKKLNKLTGEFCIAKLEKVQSANEANEASLRDKIHIKKLKLRWSDYQSKKPNREDERILENLHPSRNLEEIHIVCYPGINLPSWIPDESFTKLFSITLFRCENISVLPALGKLPSLKALELIGLNSVKKMEYRGAGEHVAFPKLQKLVIEEMLNLETWEKAQKGNDYPNLIMLDITNCPKLPEIPILPYLSSIEHFEISGCNKLAFLSGIVLSSSLKQLIVEDCPLIQEKCSKETGEDWYKIQHVPTIWIDQEAIQTINSPKQPTENEKDDEQDLSLQNLETERQKDVEQDHSTLQNLEIASQTDDDQDYLSLQNLDEANQVQDIKHDHSTIQNLENASQKEEITLSPSIQSQRHATKKKRHKLPRKMNISVKRFSWRSIFPCYNILDDPLVPKPKAIKQATDQFHRLGISDLSNPNSLTLSEDQSISLAGSNIHSFSLQELKLITRNFSPINSLGEGGFGRVYKGFIDDRVRPGLKAQPVAVKLFNPYGAQGRREWLAKVTFLWQLRNPHLVKLIGYCCEDEYRLLVYEYMPRGSLENQLFRETTASLPWLIRIKIALGAAKGLAFLHEAENRVIYRDFKTSNILLDADFTAKLSDFGLAKDGPEGDDTHVSTRVMGTLGYAAPEYIMTGHLTAASDVYSFGVVLLELLMGRRSIDNSRIAREQILAKWARPQLNNPKRLSRIMDPRLQGRFSRAGARKAAALAYQCLSPEPKNRPTMTVVVETLLMCLESSLTGDASGDPGSAPRRWSPGGVTHRILTLGKQNKPQLKKGMEDH